MAYNKRFAVDTLMAVALDLKRYDSQEFRDHATWLIMIAAEIRKEFPAVPTVAELQALLPLPGKSDPNSKIPIPPNLPKGSGPVKVPLTNGVAA